jgi:2,4-dienoyl-CoA reductase (NADPH2)
MFMEKACLADSAARVKKVFDIPVMAVGRINDPVVADAIIAEGKADLVCIGRGLLSDPELPKKAQEGRLEDIRICIACNTCMESIFRRGRVECLVNPTLGREKEMQLTPASPPKKVMVIGGGPGGLNVAWVAAKRGHEVHLYEKQANLGGQLILGSITSYKKELLSLIEYQKTQIRKFGVRCHMNFEVSLDTIKQEDPDVIILATGSSPVTPPVPGIDKPIVSTFIEVFNGDKPSKRKTVVVGGGATGCEVALHLSENGCHVTIVEQLPKIGGQLESITKKVLISKMKENGIQSMPGYRLSKVEDNGVLVTDNEGNDLFIEAESVVVSIGNKPDNSLYDEINALGRELYQIGDCLEPRSAKAAIYEGAVIGRAI